MKMAAAAAASISRSISRRTQSPCGSFRVLPFSISSISSVAEQPSTSASTSSSSSQAQGRQKGIWSKCLLFIPGAISFGLGTWQIFRRKEKIEMLEYRRKRLEMDPITWNNAETLSRNLDSLEFTRMACRGVFDDKRSIFVGPRSRSISGVTENGYYVITPLLPIPGDPESVQTPVLVNRGWVPRSWRDKSLKDSRSGDTLNLATPSPQDSKKSTWWRLWPKKDKIVKEQIPTSAPVEVVGVVRGSEKPNVFVPANDPGSSQWFYVDVPAIAQAARLPDNTIYVENIDEHLNPSNPYPLPKDANTLIRSSVMPQDHLNYILTWYSLSAAVTFMAFKRLQLEKTWR